ncbi:MAG: transglutaminase-like domain-containing protein [Phycisphaerales bacterium]|nr:transglutaminase-like domain-containing protein [Phycisphaerales bacterium]
MFVSRRSCAISMAATLFMALGASGDSDLWYEMKLAGSPAGWSHMIDHVEGDQRKVMNETAFRLRRAGVEVAMTIQIEWVESVDGTPVSMTSRQDMGVQQMTTIWTFEGDSIKIATEQDGRRNETTVAAPTVPWLTPGALQEVFKRDAKAGKKEINLSTLAPDFGPEPVAMTYTYTGTDRITIDGKEQEVTVWSMTMEKLPFPSVMKYSSDWTLLANEMKAPFGQIDMILSSRSEAMNSVEGEGPELMLNLMIRPDKPIPDWLSAKKGRFRLHAKDGAMPKLPSAGYQRIEPTAKAGTVVQVMDLDAPSVASKEELENPQYTGSSGMVDTRDATIRELVAQALHDAGSDKAERAEAMRAFVHRWISIKNYRTAFASASETARNRTGDCSEHGVLLAAMLRIDGIPSRLATGLVYFQPEGDKGEGVYGWHMWTQAIIDDHWIDLDATLPVPFTIGHVLADTSSLSDETGIGDQYNLLALLGNMEIDVIEVDAK